MFTMKVVSPANTFEIPKECISKVEFTTDIPQDSDARTADVGATLVIQGRVLTALDGDPFDSTKQMALWSAVPAVSRDCYRSVTVKNVRGGVVEREYTFPNAFVVSYEERFSDAEGVGLFKLEVKQRRDLIEKLSVGGGFSGD